MSIVSQGCAIFRREPDFIIHDLPLAQLYALLACDAWGKGMEPVGETYEDREVMRCLAEIQAANPLPADD